jgi:DNA-binding PadR family transcriptional regulator
MNKGKASSRRAATQKSTGTRDPAGLIPLRPVEFEILLVLTGGDAHGYAIMKETEGRTDGRTRLETGTLYRALRRLTADGLVKPADEKPAADVNDERRRYFAITPFGRDVAVAEARRLATQVDAARARALLDGVQTPGSAS